MKSIVGLVLFAALLIAPTAWAQKPVSLGDVVTQTVTIVAIDHTSRVVTLKDKNGETGEMVCGPEVKRFDQLKVGDKVTFQYHESLVSAISRPGAAAKPPASGGITRAADKVGGTVSRQMNASVTILAIDSKVPSVTVQAANGDKMSFKVENAKNLEGYKAGDKVDITYTQALAISVESSK
jgi:Cu/Ag efflux protein CusF